MEETILLVDDDAALLEVTSIVLASEGYRVLTAEDGVEALRILGRETLDLVVLDIMLPRMSGFEVLKKMREQSDVPVVLLTAKSQSVDKVVGLELGADDYITKPFDTKELLARIKAILRRFGLLWGVCVAQVESMPGIWMKSKRICAHLPNSAILCVRVEARVLDMLQA